MGAKGRVNKSRRQARVGFSSSLSRARQPTVRSPVSIEHARQSIRQSIRGGNVGHTWPIKLLSMLFMSRSIEFWTAYDTQFEVVEVRPY